MSRDSASDSHVNRDGHALVREILVPRTLLLTSAREIEGYDGTRELDRWIEFKGVPT